MANKDIKSSSDISNGLENLLNDFAKSLSNDFLKNASKQLVEAFNSATKNLSSFTQTQKASTEAATAQSFALSAVSSVLNAGLSIAVSAAISYLYKLSQRHEEMRQSAIKLSEAFNTEKSEIDSYVSKITDLRKALDSNTLSTQEAYNARKDLLELQNEVVGKYGDEVSGIDLVNGSLKDQIGLFNDITKKQAIDNLNSADTKDVVKEYERTDRSMHFGIGAASSYGKDELVQQVSKILDDNEINYLAPDAGGISAYIDGSYADIEKKSNSVYESLNELKSLQANSEDKTFIDTIINSLSDGTEKAKEFNDEYEKIYNEITMQKIIASQGTDNDYSAMYSEIYEAQAAYEEAVAKDNPEEIAKALEQINKVGINLDGANISDQGVKKLLDELYGKLQDEASNNTFKLDLQTSVSEADGGKKQFGGYIQNAFQGKDDSAVLDMAKGNTSNLSPEQQQSFSLMNQFAKEYNLSLEQVVQSLVEMGYIQGNIFSDNTSIQSQIKNVEALGKGFEYMRNVTDDLNSQGSFDLSNLADENFVNTFKDSGQAYEDFVKTVSESPSDIGACQEAFDNLVGTWLNSSDAMESLTEENADATIAMLEQEGVANASAIVYNELAKKKADAALASMDLTDVTYADIEALALECGATAEGRDGFMMYVAQKLLAQLAIDPTGDISALAAIVSSLGIASTAWDNYYRAKLEMDRISNMSDKDWENEQVKNSPKDNNDKPIHTIVSRQQGIDANRKKMDVYGEQAAKDFENLASKFEIPAGFGGGGGKSGGGGSSSSANTQKTAFDEEKKVLDHALAMEEITQGEYYDTLRGLNDKYFKDRKDYIDEYQKYEEEIFKGMAKVRDDEFKESTSQIEHKIKKLARSEGTEEAQAESYRELQNVIQVEIDWNIEQGAEETDSKIRELKEQLWDAEDSQKDVYKKQLDNRVDAYEKYIDSCNDMASWGSDSEIEAWKRCRAEVDMMFSQGKISAEDYASYCETIMDNMADATETAFEAYKEKVVGEIDSKIDKLNKKLEDKNEIYDSQIEALENQKDLLSQQAEEEDRLLAIEKARMELQKAKDQKNVAVYREGIGIVYEADQTAVDEAQNNLDDLLADKDQYDMEKEIDAQIENLENLKQEYEDSINAEIENLEKLKEEWEKSLDLEEDVNTHIANFQSLQALEGLSLDERIKKVDEFRQAWLNAHAAANGMERKQTGVEWSGTDKQGNIVTGMAKNEEEALAEAKKQGLSNVETDPVYEQTQIAAKEISYAVGQNSSSLDSNKDSLNENKDSVNKNSASIDTNSSSLSTLTDEMSNNSYSMSDLVYALQSLKTSIDDNTSAIRSSGGSGSSSSGGGSTDKRQVDYVSYSGITPKGTQKGGIEDTMAEAIAKAKAYGLTDVKYETYYKYHKGGLVGGGTNAILELARQRLTPNEISAVLEKRETVLTEDHATNLFKNFEDISGSFGTYINLKPSNYSNMLANAKNNNNSAPPVQVTNNFDNSFPNVESAAEIKRAFNSLELDAIQFASRIK